MRNYIQSIAGNLVSVHLMLVNVTVPFPCPGSSKIFSTGQGAQSMIIKITGYENLNYITVLLNVVFITRDAIMIFGDGLHSIH